MLNKGLSERRYGYLPRRGGKTEKEVHKPRRRMRLGLQTTAIAASASAAFGVLILTVFIAWISRDLPDPDRLSDRHVAQSTKIYDRTGKRLLYEIFANEKRTLVELNDIPKTLVNAVIATEDADFYQHRGVRPLSIIRSFVYGILGRGRVGGGASTLTQQLVKNAILTNERTLTRKAKEIILSLRLEQKYSKDQILKIYFNEIPYGSTNYGAEAAAQSYFGKHVSDITLDEAAILAGIPKAPSLYLTNAEALKTRRDYALDRMTAEGYISAKEADDAKTKPVALRRRFTNIEAPHFTLYVKQLLIDRFGEKMVDTGGLRVVTTLDWEKQELAERVIGETGEKVLKEAGANNASLVAIDPKTGHILAMVGSMDFFDESIDGQFNVATLGRRQPGSSFKPIVYAAAFEKGYTPDTLLFDVKTNFAVKGKDYIPENYDGKEHGLVTMRAALQGSLNVPSVQTLYLVGAENGIKMAERMGYTTLGEGNFGLSLVLGGGEVKLLEHISAYGIFANRGIRQAPVAIMKVEAGRGDILYEWKKSAGERVLDEGVADTVSSLLSDDESRAFIFGAGGALTIPGRTVAAKTGTTNNYVDAWTVGFTPSLVAGVWAGNTDNTPMKKGFGGSMVAARLWNAFMREAVRESPPEPFPPPPENDAEKPILRGSLGGSIRLMINKATGRIAVSSTPAELIIEREFIPPHSILHYVNKDDPRGPTPENPDSDPQYAVWEAAIADWVARARRENPSWDVRFDDPPREFDDPALFPLIPVVEVVSPAAGSVLDSRKITVEIRASAPRGVAQVTYTIDGIFVKRVSSPPFGATLYLPALKNGEHTLGIIVEDDNKNLRLTESPFMLSAGEEPPRLYFTTLPREIPAGNFPTIITLNTFRLKNIKEARVLIEHGGGRSVLTTFTSPAEQAFNDQLSARWDIAEPGEWTLIAEITDASGQHESDRIDVLVQ